jgi:hypothetical protein
MKTNSGPFKGTIKTTVKTEPSKEESKTGIQSAFNEFIKVPTFLLAYLYFISICYHSGYWNGFRIDVFNFYSVQDLAKGATHGMAETILFVIIFAIPLVIVGFLLHGNLRNAVLKLVLNYRKTYFATIALFIAIDGLLFYYNRKTKTSFQYIASSIIPNNDKVLLPKFFIAIFIVIVYSCIITILINKQFLNEARLKDRFFKIITYSFVLILPAISYLSALNNSMLNRRGTKFDYIVSKKISGKSSVYKYLGTAGGYCFLSTIDGRKIITIKGDSLQPLIVSYYSAYDSASVRLLLKEYKLAEKTNRVSEFISHKEKTKASTDSLKTKKKISQKK